MGILNTTPDSFYAGSRAPDLASAVAMAREQQAAGAAVIDVGGESTRPGAARVDAQEQIRRVVPVVRAILDGLGAGGAGERRTPVLSVDTTSATVARAALDAGVEAINDVSAGLEDPGMLPLAAERGCGLILMHRALPPERDSYSDRYAAPPMSGDVVEQVRAFLRARAEAAIEAGVETARIMLDPGLGFGKTVEQNIALIRGIGSILSIGFPVLGAVSRKSFVGRIGEPGRETAHEERLPATIALGLALVSRGVRLLRVHDVGAHGQALRAWGAAEGGV